jgi:hypothetical protein
VPHLSKIQKDYAGKVNVIGVNAFEEQNPKDNSYFTKIDKYIADMGDKMSYTVAADGYEGKMTKAWMTASESAGIPTSFVVGKDGTVLFIGHPMQLDKVLDDILAGTYDLAGATAKDQQRRESSRAQREAFGPITAALKAKDSKAAVAAIDAAIAKNPKFEQMLALTKFNQLAMHDEPAAMAYARSLSEGSAKDNPNILNSLAWAMVDDKTKLKNPDLGLAVRIAEKGFAQTKETDMMYVFTGDTLAYALYKNGQLDRALDTQTKVVAALDKLKGIPEPTIKEVKDRLDMYKAKKAGGRGG